MQTRSLVALALCVLVCLAPFANADGQFLTINFDGRNNKLYVPSAAANDDPLPLFVMLHGCTQDPSDFAAGTMMNTYAEEQGFFVLYPEQPFSANFNKCWNWFLPADQARDSGEPQIIATLTQKIMNSYSVNSTAVFVGGLSAGAAMTVIMGATYPDLYHGLAVGAGLEYKAATSTLSAFSAMASGGPSPSTQAGVAFSAMGSNYKKAIPTLVIQGTSDYTVNPVNGEQTTLQMVGTNNLIMGSDKISTDPTSTLQGQVPDGRSYSQLLYTDGPSGRVLVQHIEVDGMGHAWSGGSSSGSYTDPSGPNASEIMYKWFLGLSPH